MRVPSGDHAGLLSAAVPLASVSRRTPCPSACMIQIDRLLSDRLSKAILVPSGDHAGRASKARGRLVSVWAALPSRLTTKTDAGTILGGVRLTLGPPSGTGGDVGVVVPELWWSTA